MLRKHYASNLYGIFHVMCLDCIVYVVYNDIMAIVNVRNLPDDVHAKLRIRAAIAGRSMEAEVRAIVIATIAGNLVEQTAVAQTIMAEQRVKDYRALMKQLQQTNTGRKFSRDEANEHG